MNLKKAILTSIMLLIIASAAAAEDCDVDGDCDDDDGYTCRAGDVHRFIQTYRCSSSGTCVKDEKIVDDDTYDVCERQDRMECIEGQRRCQPMTDEFFETTSTTMYQTTTSSTTSTSSSSTSSTSSSTTTSSQPKTTSTTLTPQTTTTTQPGESFLVKITYRRPIEVELECIKHILNAIFFWD